MMETGVLLVQYSDLDASQRKAFLREHPELRKPVVAKWALTAARIRGRTGDVQAALRYGSAAKDLAEKLGDDQLAAEADHLLRDLRGTRAGPASGRGAEKSTSALTQRMTELVERLVDRRDMSVAGELTLYGYPVVSHIVAKVGDVWDPDAREAGLSVIAQIEGPVTAELLEWCLSFDSHARCTAIMAIDDRVSARKPDCIPYVAHIRAIMQEIADNDPFSRAKEEAESVLKELDKQGW